MISSISGLVSGFQPRFERLRFVSTATQSDLSLIGVSPLFDACHVVPPVTNRVTRNDSPNWASEERIFVYFKVIELL